MDWLGVGQIELEEDLADLVSRLRAYEAGEHDSLDDELTERSLRLLEASGTQPATDGQRFEIIRAVAWLFWYRSLACPEDDSYLRTARGLFETIELVNPAVVPRELLHIPNKSTHRKAPATEIISEARIWLARAESSLDHSDFDEAISLLYTVAYGCIGHDRYRATVLSELGTTQKKAFDLTGDISYLNSAITTFSTVADSADPVDPESALYLWNVASALAELAEATGESRHLDTAIFCLRMAQPDAKLSGLGELAVTSELSFFLWQRYRLLAKLSDLDEAISLARKAAATSGLDVSEQVRRLVNLADAVACRFQEAKKDSDLDEAIMVYTAIGILAEPSNSHWAVAGRNLASLYRVRYARTEDPGDLDNAIRHYMNLCDAHSISDVKSDGDECCEAKDRYFAGNLLLRRYQHDKSDVDLDRAIIMLTSAAESCRGSAEAAFALDDLATALIARSDARGDKRDLDIAIARLRELAELPADSAQPGHHPRRLADVLATRPGAHRRVEDVDDVLRAYSHALAQANADETQQHAEILLNLAEFRRARFALTNEFADLDRALSDGHAALDLAASAEVLFKARTSISRTLRMRSSRTEQISDLDQAIALCRQSIQHRPDSSLVSLGLLFYDRFKVSHQVEDLHEAINCGRQALQLLSAPDTHRAEALDMLCLALWRKCEHGGTRADAQEALRTAEEAIRLTPSDSDVLFARHDSACLAWVNMVNWSNSTTDADNAVAAGRAAVEAYSVQVREQNRDRPSPAWLWINLASALQARSRLTGDGGDLDEAIKAVRAAIGLEPGDSAPMLSNLSAMLHSRWALYGDSADLDEAVTVARKACDLARDGELHQPRFLINLAIALSDRYDQARVAADLDGAIQVIESVLSMPSAETNIQADALYLLSDALLSRARRDDNRDDLDRAIQSAREALSLIPSDGPGAALRLSRLAAALWMRYRYGPDPAILDEVIEMGRAAIAAASEKETNFPAYANHLPHALLRRFKLTGDRQDYAEAVRIWRTSAVCRSAPARVRAEAAKWWAVAAGMEEDWASAADGYCAVVELLPLVAWRGVGSGDRERLLGEFLGLASDAAACLIAIGQVQQAVTVLDQGRGILWSQHLEEISDLSALAAVHPKLAKRVQEVRAAIDSGDRLNGPPIESQLVHSQGDVPLVDGRMSVAAQWDDLLAEVRSMEGFEEFLLPPDLASLQAATKNGTAVIVNLSHWRCDALAVDGEGVTLIELPRLILDEAFNRSEEYVRSLRGIELRTNELFRIKQRVVTGRHSAQAIRVYVKAMEDLVRHRSDLETMLTNLLAWLWDTIAEPVIEKLSTLGKLSYEHPLPRVWWCPTGALNLLPLHAAGHRTPHAEGHTSTVLDRVVSSYIPTLRALAASVMRQQQHATAERFMVVAVSGAPSLPPLSDVGREIGAIKQLLSGRVTVLAEGGATREAVVSALSEHRHVHFSCHGGQDLDHPSEGGVRLFDELLNIREIRGRSYSGEFAFLSACKTATGGQALPDEAITLAAAMHHAGYRHVIGTLWTVFDSTAADFTQLVYGDLVSNGSLRPENSAYALHGAVTVMRNRYPVKPSMWSTFVHIGP